MLGVYDFVRFESIYKQFLAVYNSARANHINVLNACQHLNGNTTITTAVAAAATV